MSKSQLLDEIRQRGRASLEQSLLLLQLFPSSDAEEKRRLAPLAARCLPEPALVSRLIELASAERDPGALEALCEPLFGLDPRSLPASDAWVALLSSLLTSAAADEQLRGRASHALGQLVAQSPAAQEALVAACRATQSRSHERRLLSALAALEQPPAPVVALFSERLRKVDPALALLLLERLAAAGALQLEQLIPLLGPEGPASVRLLALEQIVSRSLQGPGLLPALTSVLAHDPDPAVRSAAVRALAARGEGAEALLTALRGDPEPAVRAAAALAFHHSLEQSPGALAALAEALRTERTASGLSLLLALLSPQAGRSPEVRKALVELLRRGLQAAAAAQLFATLGRLAAVDAGLLPLLLQAVATEQHAAVRAALLEALLTRLWPGAQQLELLLQALASSEPKLRELGARGLLHAVLEPSHCPQLAPAVDALPTLRLGRWTLLPLAHKLARLAEADPACTLAPHFRRAAARLGPGDDGATDELRSLCERAGRRLPAGSAPSAEWDEWLHRAQVEQRSEGLFPDLFVHFDEAPEKARRIFWAVLTPPTCETLYSTYAGQLSSETLIAWLRDRDLVDDDLSRLALAWLLDPEHRYRGGDGLYLSVLRSNPRFPGLGEAALRLLEVRGEAPPVLLRELLLAGFGGDEARLGAELVRRVAAVESEEAALLWIRFLHGNAVWPPAQAAFGALRPGAPPWNSEPCRQPLHDLAKALHRELPKPPVDELDLDPVNTEGPGFADE